MFTISKTNDEIALLECATIFAFIARQSNVPI